MSNRTPFSHDDVEQILKVVDRLNDVEVTLETGDLKLHVRKGAAAGAPTPAPRPASAAAAIPAAAAPKGAARRPQADAARIPEGAIAIRAPMLGTFYRAPSPADAPFVEAGRHVAAGAPVCIIEVMKLFNTVNAAIGGTIVEVVAENGAMVEYNQLLFVLQPDA